jgi:hypothetical protein
MEGQQFYSPTPTRQSSAQASRHSQQHPVFHQPTRGNSLFDGLKGAPLSNPSQEARVDQDLALYASASGQSIPYDWSKVSVNQGKARLLRETPFPRKLTSLEQDRPPAKQTSYD